MARVAVASLMHESNSFNPVTTPQGEFRLRDHSLDNWRHTNTEMAGFIGEAERLGIESVPAFYATATPGGAVEEQAFESLVDCLLTSIAAAGSVDGVYLALHGAMVAEHIPHADQEVVRRVRNMIGPNVPLVVTHDFHANIPPGILDLTTALLTYQENPHLDTEGRGRRAASILARTLRGEAHPVQAIAKPPMILNIIHQNTYSEPLRQITRDSQELERQPDILAASVAGGYQYADVPYVGPSAVVVADGSKELAHREAHRLSARLWALRDELSLDLPDPARAVAAAVAAGEFPVALFDAGDNVMGGAAGDGTAILAELVGQRAQGWVVVICDPAAVRAAIAAGLDAGFDFDVGGKRDGIHGPPVHIQGRVRSLHVGRYLEPEVRHGGERFHDIGHAAVIEADGSTPSLQNLLLLTSLRSHPNSIHQLVSCGIYPERQRILVVKGVIAPRAAYEPFVKEISLVDSPGATAVDPARLQYRLARPGLLGMS